MGKKNRDARNKRRADEFKGKLHTYIESVPQNCKGKTYAEIIDDYCTVFGFNSSEWHYKSYYTEQELKSIYNI